MAQLTGHVPAVPRAWPLPPCRGEAAVGGAPAVGAAGSAAPAGGQGHPTFADVVAAFNATDLVAHQVGEGVDPPTSQPNMTFM
eukprot:731435-Alexandrium_andersonii.AAC.1